MRGPGRRSHAPNPNDGGALLTDEALFQVEGPESWAPIHALHLLAAIGGPRAADAVERAICLDQVHGFLGDWLEDAGPFLGGLGREAMDHAKRLGGAGGAPVALNGASVVDIFTAGETGTHETRTLGNRPWNGLKSSRTRRFRTCRSRSS